jgi:hypothetical protein
LRTICLGWLWTTILLISASCARIAGLSATGAHPYMWIWGSLFYNIWKTIEILMEIIILSL